jgi:hypothetical protein
VSYTFDTSGDGTLVTADVRSQLRGFLRLAQPIARYISLRQRRAYLAKAKEILETGPQAR